MNVPMHARDFGPLFGPKTQAEAKQSFEELLAQIPSEDLRRKILNYETIERDELTDEVNDALEARDVREEMSEH